MKFTKTELDLCKQIAEKERKDINYGDWFLNEGGFTKVWLYRHNCKRIDVIPLWTIEDCLEFLRKKPNLHTLEIIGDYHKLEWNVVLNWADTYYEGKTPLEALLKAVLAVLEER